MIRVDRTVHCATGSSHRILARQRTRSARAVQQSIPSSPLRVEAMREGEYRSQGAFDPIHGDDRTGPGMQLRFSVASAHGGRIARLRTRRCESRNAAGSPFSSIERARSFGSFSFCRQEFRETGQHLQPQRLQPENTPHQTGSRSTRSAHEARSPLIGGEPREAIDWLAEMWPSWPCPPRGLQRQCGAGTGHDRAKRVSKSESLRTALGVASSVASEGRGPTNNRAHHRPRAP